MARLATSAPLAYDGEASGALLAQARTLADASPDPADRFSTCFGELYRYGGPAHAAGAEPMGVLERLCNASPRRVPLPLVLLDLHRALSALQSGDLAPATRALDRARTRSGALETELSWHFERASMVLRLQQGDDDVRTSLRALHARAESDDPILGAELLCAYDRSVLLATPETPATGAITLAAASHDPPNVWAWKLRTLAASGCDEEARGALGLVAPKHLTRLPCDRDYLGTLGALVHASVQLGAAAHQAVLYELLRPYAAYFAVNLSFVCEGSVWQLLGMLSRALGEHERARQQLEAAIDASERAGLKASSVDARRHLEAL